MIDLAQLAAETERIYRRYAVEVVEAFGFCPWAAQAREEGRVRVTPVLDRTPGVDRLLRAVEAMERDRQVDIGLLILPRYERPRSDFLRLTAALREADSDSKGRDKTIVAMADFHPDVEPDLQSPERLVGFIRRSPDPTVQLVRKSVLSAVRMTENSGTRFIDLSQLPGGDPATWPSPPEPLARRIARMNLATVEQIGVDAVRARLDDILRDRDESYARLGLPPPPWSPRRDPRHDTLE